MAYLDMVRQLVQWHFEDDQPPTDIYAFLDPEEKEIRLLEVTDLVPETGEVYPVAFGRTDDVPCRTVIVQVTPREFARIRNHDPEMELPDGWGDLDGAQQMRPQEIHA